MPITVNNIAIILRANEQACWIFVKALLNSLIVSFQRQNI